MESESFYNIRDRALGKASQRFVIEIKTSLQEKWATEKWKWETNATNVVIHVPLQAI